ncbi:hypothetical protein F3Y22_tig00110415pilonHSYRG00197 [Hibiscus syriacus]|uniref:Uncharacterized protein n=1 Tax=Hibiscus syriacus TaxID=106335 RepID=A0A6A3APP8_HIBSY|nr:hypothetical protein F3Y22_tig00110415pilonHSYRG00197 [Hibiscus syriacus]
MGDNNNKTLTAILATLTRLTTQVERFDEIVRERQKPQLDLPNQNPRPNNVELFVPEREQPRFQAPKLFSKPKFTIPSFKGDNDPDRYIEWEGKVDLMFAYHDCPQAKQVHLITTQFEGYARTWWMQTRKKIHNFQIPTITSWTDLKQTMRKRFLPAHYTREVKLRLDRLQQGRSSVEEYYKEIQSLLNRANITEKEEVTVSRFIVGLNSNIIDLLDLQGYENLEDTLKKAMTIEAQIQRRSRFREHYQGISFSYQGKAKKEKAEKEAKAKVVTSFKSQKNNDPWEDFQEVLGDPPNELPPERGKQHQTNLIQGSIIPRQTYNIEETKELDLLRKGYIQENLSRDVILMTKQDLNNSKGFIDRAPGIHVNDEKVKTTRDWPTPFSIAKSYRIVLGDPPDGLPPESPNHYAISMKSHQLLESRGKAREVIIHTKHNSFKCITDRGKQNTVDDALPRRFYSPQISSREFLIHEPHLGDLRDYFNKPVDMVFKHSFSPHTNKTMEKLSEAIIQKANSGRRHVEFQPKHQITRLVCKRGFQDYNKSVPTKKKPRLKRIKTHHIDPDSRMNPFEEWGNDTYTKVHNTCFIGLMFLLEPIRRTESRRFKAYQLDTTVCLLSFQRFLNRINPISGTQDMVLLLKMHLKETLKNPTCCHHLPLFIPHCSSSSLELSRWILQHKKAILRKDGCLTAISERPMDFTDDNKWIEMDGNVMANFHLALADENKNVLNFYFKVYRIHMINLTNSNITSLVFDDVVAVVLQEENRRKNKEDKQVNLQQAEALTTMRGRSTERGQSSSHKHGRSKSRSKKNLKCYNCGKNGHLKKDCWSLNKNSNPQGNTANTSDDEDSLCCEASTTVEGGSVYSCNDHALEIISVGTIKLKMYDGTIKVFRGALVVLKGENIVANLYMLKRETLLEAEASVASCSSDSEMLWHQKLGHMSEQGMKVLVEKKLLPGLIKVSLPLCEHYITSKQHRLKFNTSNSRAKSVLELVHSDVWQAPVTSLGGAKYFVSFIDDCSRRCWVYPIKKKSDVFSTFKSFKARVELDSGNKIKCFRIDNGGEYTSEEFDDFCRKEGIKRQFTMVNTPQQNRVAERMNRTLLERTRTMLRDTNVEKSFWAEAVNIACYLVNRAPSTAIELKTPMEMWTEDYEPSTYQEVINSSDTSLWMMAMQEEIEALHKNNTWDLVSLPQVRKPIEQLDVKTTFLHGNLEEEIYMFQPEGFEEKEKKNLVCRLNKSLYGLKQAPRCWYKRFDSFIMCLGYNKLNANPCAYFKRSELKAQLAREFEMTDLGSANKILGMQIHRDRSNRKSWLSKKNYLKNILSRFNMQDCKPISTHLPINFKLSSSMSPSSEEERMEMSRVPYASAVGSLMFAMICTRPDIAQAVGVSVVATSTTEVEYVAATQASKEAIWLKMLLEELGHNQENKGYDSGLLNQSSGSTHHLSFAIATSINGGGSSSCMSKRIIIRESPSIITFLKFNSRASLMACSHAVASATHGSEIFSRFRLIVMPRDSSDDSLMEIGAISVTHSKSFTNMKVSVILNEFNYLIWKQHVIFSVRRHRMKKLLYESVAPSSQTVVRENVLNSFLSSSERSRMWKFGVQSTSFSPVFRGALVVLKGEKIVANLYMLKGETLIEAEASVASCSSDSAMLWHQKLEHMSEQEMKFLVEQKLLPGLTKVSLPLCEHCITSKQHRLKFNASNSRGKGVLELVHSDVYPIKKKSDVFSNFKNFKARVELDSGKKNKCFRTDNGGEYTSEEFDDFCRKEGIKRQLTVANTPQQNGAEAVNTACYLVNRAPSTAIVLKTLMEMWTGKPADYSNLHVFGSIVYVMYNSQEISKLDPKSRKCKFLGYADRVKGYHLWDPTARKVIISRDVIFVEDKLQRKEDDDSAEKSETTQIHVEKEFEQGDYSEAEPAHDEQEPESSEAPTTRQSDRVRRRPNWHSDYVIECNIAYCLLTGTVSHQHTRRQ